MQVHKGMASLGASHVSPTQEQSTPSTRPKCTILPSIASLIENAPT